MRFFGTILAEDEYFKCEYFVFERERFIYFIFLGLYFLGNVAFCCRLNLANDQLDAQFLYFIIRLLQSSTCVEQRRAHHQELEFY